MLQVCFVNFHQIIIVRSRCLAQIWFLVFPLSVGSSDPWLNPCFCMWELALFGIKPAEDRVSDYSGRQLSRKRYECLSSLSIHRCILPSLSFTYCSFLTERRGCGSLHRHCYVAQ